MDQIQNCLSADLHGLLYQFIYNYVEKNKTNIDAYGYEFFEEIHKTGKWPSPRSIDSTSQAIDMLTSDPAALYKLVECDPDILDLRDKLKFLVLSYLMDNPQNTVEYGAEYFKKKQNGGTRYDCRMDESMSKTTSPTRRDGVASSNFNPEETVLSDINVPFYEKTPEQLTEMREKIQHALLFRSLDDQQMSSVLKAMFKLEVKKDEFVIRQGDDGDYFYVVDRGIFEAYVKDGTCIQKKVSTYEGTGSFGELALLYNMPRVATVKAITDGALWCLDRDSFRKIVVRSAFKKRKKYEKLIQKVPMLQELNDYERQTLADALLSITFEDGECIIKQSEEAAGMYLVEEGVVLFSYMDEKGRVSKLSKILEGGYFGELALVTNKTRAVSAYASGFVRLAFIDRESFERLLGPCLDIMKRNVSYYSEQLKAMQSGS